MGSRLPAKERAGSWRTCGPPGTVSAPGEWPFRDAPWESVLMKCFVVRFGDGWLSGTDVWLQGVSGAVVCACGTPGTRRPHTCLCENSGAGSGNFIGSLAWLSDLPSHFLVALVADNSRMQGSQCLIWGSLLCFRNGRESCVSHPGLLISTLGTGVCCLSGSQLRDSSKALEESVTGRAAGLVYSPYG